MSANNTQTTGASLASLSFPKYLKASLHPMLVISLRRTFLSLPLLSHFLGHRLSRNSLTPSAAAATSAGHMQAISGETCCVALVDGCSLVRRHLISGGDGTASTHTSTHNQAARLSPAACESKQLSSLSHAVGFQANRCRMTTFTRREARKGFERETGKQPRIQVALLTQDPWEKREQERSVSLSPFASPTANGDEESDQEILRIFLLFRRQSLCIKSGRCTRTLLSHSVACLTP